MNCKISFLTFTHIQLHSTFHNYIIIEQMGYHCKRQLNRLSYDTNYSVENTIPNDIKSVKLEFPNLFLRGLYKCILVGLDMIFYEKL